MDKSPGEDKRTAIMFYGTDGYPDLLNMDITGEDMVDIMEGHIDSDITIRIQDNPGEDSRTVARQFGEMLGNVRPLMGPMKGYYIEIGSELKRMVIDDNAPDDEFGCPFTYYAFRKSYLPELLGIIEKYVKVQRSLKYSRDKRISQAIEGPDFLMFRD